MRFVVTVRDVLDERALRLRPAVLADPTLPVRWTATSELTDPTPFLEGGEVLLTTGLNTDAWRGEWAAYVDRLQAVGVAALGVGTGLTHPALPSALVEACETRGVNLFEVPRETTFVAISHAVAGLIEKHRQAVAREALALQRELTTAALRRDPVAVLRRLATVLHGAVGTVTAAGRWALGPVGAEPSRLDLGRLSAEVVRLRPQGLRASSSGAESGGSWLVQPLGLTGVPDRYLTAWSPGRLDEGQRSALTTAVALLSLVEENRQQQRQTVRGLRARALELLLAGDARTAEVVLTTASASTLTGTVVEPSLPTRVQVLRAGGDAHTREQGLRMCEDEVAGPSPVAAALIDGQLCVACSPTTADRLAERLAGLGLHVGIGDTVPASEAIRSHTAAGHALDLATPGSPVVRWVERVRGGVLGLLGEDLAESFARSTLSRLDEAASPTGELLLTLRSFLRHHGRPGPVAEELGVHRNTVRNRVREIERALGGSLDDPQVRVDAWVALQADADRHRRQSS